MRHITILLLFLLTTTSLFAAETRGLTVVAKDSATNQSGEVKLYNKSYAVIIGIDEYPKLPADRQLRYAVNDAKGVESALRRNFRFDRIVTLYDREATKDRILELLTDELPAQMGEEDSLFVFWAGHGNQEKSRTGDIGYLIPHDGTPSKFSSNISMTQLKDDISRKIPAKHVFYVMDACYGGLLAETRAVDKQSKRDLSYLKEITKEQVRQVLTAGSKGQEVLDGGPKGHSVFTGRLIEALEAAGDFITANEIQAVLREKVYGDAKGRGHNQTPGYGTFSGSGDFVFVPNIEQKVQDNRAEVARMEAELKRLMEQESEAKKYQSEQQQREAEQKKKSTEAKLKAEQLRQQQLAEEAKRQQEMSAERARFEADQKVREQQLASASSAEEKRLAALKAEIALKKQTVPSSAGRSLEAVIAEIWRLNANIETIEKALSAELTAGKSRVEERYRAEIETVRQASTINHVLPEKDEFETEAEYRQRLEKLKSSFSDRISELKEKQQKDIEALSLKMENELQNQTAELRQSLRQLAEKSFTVGAESIAVELGRYDTEKQHFPVTLQSKNPLIKVAMNGTIPLPKDAARTLKQQFLAGAIRPQVGIKGGGEIGTIALANDVDSSIYEYADGEFMTVAERKRKFEFESIIYTDKSTGLQWTRNGNIANKEMNWQDAMIWIKNLNYGGYSDWRLPSLQELEEFAKVGGDRPAEYFNSNGFSNIQYNFYWSSSTYASNNVSAWVFNFYDGNKKCYWGNTNYVYIWPVRNVKP